MIAWINTPYFKVLFHIRGFNRFATIMVEQQAAAQEIWVW